MPSLAADTPPATAAALASTAVPNSAHRDAAGRPAVLADDVAAAAEAPAHHLLSSSRTRAIVCELLAPAGVPLGAGAVDASSAPAPPQLAFRLLRVRTTGADAQAEDVYPTLGFFDAALECGQPMLVLFDFRATASLRPPPLALLRAVFSWAHANAVSWDVHVQGIAVLMSNAAVRPLLQFVTRILQPPQPMLYCGTEHEALTFLAQQRTVRSHLKVA